MATGSSGHDVFLAPAGATDRKGSRLSVSEQAAGRCGAPSWLVAFLKRMEEDQRLDGPAAILARASDPLERRPALDSALRGEWLGHALHPLLTDFPLGAWIGATLLDLFGGRRARPSAAGLLTFGVCAALPTAAAGVAEWRSGAPRSRRVGVVHAALNTGALCLYVASLASRRAGRHRAGVVLALLGGASATAGGYLGGHLTLVHKLGTADPAFGVPPVRETSG
jgi:uncharacterized membrane protein